ncbi:MAG: LAGLIDADG family homing endonuclease [Eisenbergiella sp.]
MPKHITKEQKEDIIEFYKQKPITVDDVAKKFNISPPSVIKILNEYHIKRYTKVQLFSPNLYERYFENIDTEEKAYFLGLIITDGCVHNTKGKQSLLSITLKENDSYILERFKNEIKSNKKITNDGRGCCQISILSNTMVNDLKKYGVIFNKTDKTLFPSNIPEDLYKHLIRGILDGDGSVSYYSRPNRKCHVKAIRFCQGNEQFLIDIVNFLSSKIGIDKIKTYREKDSLWSIAYRKNESIKKLIDYLYDDAHIYFKRKKYLCDLIYLEINTGNTEITDDIKRLSVS